ncbi:hypothetical protein OM076_00920 [Solirubrobacter ginsenosidimutans]|uniref:Uncharacterized protein n=1 Tax=Solirubrobacter ginsenosidimutans TaxID=490573 RepID=A0A9X3MPF1_9ACTN|nr:hypothetical protein [Solirubrobacter ginsenosidimutans]MDA0158810.1 hypothetical protein [Solirubrobacter ginsenosidimutans]
MLYGCVRRCVSQRGVLSEIPASQADQDTKLDFLLLHNHSLHQAVGTLIAQVEDLRKIALEGHDLTFEAVKISAQRDELVRQLDELRHNQDTWLAVLDNKVHEEVVERDRARRARLQHRAAARSPKPLRDWMTPEELRRAAVAENRATVSRWLKGKNLPRRREFWPWEHPRGSRRRVAAEASPHLGPRHQPGVLADRLHASGA